MLLCFNVLRWQHSWEMHGIALFTFSSPQIAQGLRLEQLALVVGILVNAGAWCVSRKHFAAAGILLAVSTIKPQMALLPLCWFAIWSAGDWRKRWRVPVFFTATVAILVASGEMLLPGWIGYFLAGLAAYRRYALPTSTLGMALGNTLEKSWEDHHSWPAYICMAKSKSSGRLKAIRRSASCLLHGRLACVSTIYTIQSGAADSSCDDAFARLEDSASFFQSCFRHLRRLALDRVDRSIAISPACRFVSQLALLPFFLVPFMPLILPLLLMTRRPQQTDLPATDLSLA